MDKSNKACGYQTFLQLQLQARMSVFGLVRDDLVHCRVRFSEAVRCDRKYLARQRLRKKRICNYAALATARRNQHITVYFQGLVRFQCEAIAVLASSHVRQDIRGTHQVKKRANRQGERKVAHKHTHMESSGQEHASPDPQGYDPLPTEERYAIRALQLILGRGDDNQDLLTKSHTDLKSTGQ